jgi:hypothetical protein
MTQAKSRALGGPALQNTDTSKTTAPLLAAALKLAADARPVFLLGGNKYPVANCAPCNKAGDDHDKALCGHLLCHGFYAATCDPDRIRAMFQHVPRGMLAIRMGVVSGLVGIDVDPRNGGHESMVSLIARGLLPPTSWVQTGSGGTHLYYRHPGTRIGNDEGRKLGPGIDIRGDGGLMIAPPSIHPKTGRPYLWRAALDQAVEMPPALVQACQPLPAAESCARPASFTSAEGISRPDRLLETLLDRVRHAPEGQRRTTLYGSARGVAKMVAAGAITVTDAVAALTDAGQAAGQSPRETRTAIAGGFRDEGVTA